MKVEFNTLYWDNTPEEQIEAHRRVTSHFQLPVNYYCENVPHGMWMDHVCENSSSDVIGFLDADCIPLSRGAVMESINYVTTSDTFLGVAQVSNHIPPRTHIYAAPAFYFITKKCWSEMRTSFFETKRSDVGEELTYVAESIGKRYRCIYPSFFEREPVEGVWRLSNYGFYGVGTVFGNYCYHLYQGRFSNNLQLFLQRCNEVIRGTFSTQGFHSATNLKYEGKIVP